MYVDEPRHVACAHARRRDEVEAVLEPRVRGDAQRRPSRRTSRDRRSRRARTPPGRTPSISSSGSQRPRRSSSIRIDHPARTRGRPAARRRAAAELVEPPHGLGVEPEPAEKQKRRPLTEPSEIRRSRVLRERGADRARRGDRLARQPERARQHARASARQEAERNAAVGAVQRLVVGAVAGEARGSRRRRPAPPAASSVAWPGCCVNSVCELEPLAQRALDVRDPLAGHVRRVRVDDQERALHAREHATPHRPDRRRCPRPSRPWARLRLAHDSSAERSACPLTSRSSSRSRRRTTIDEDARSPTLLARVHAAFDFVLDRVERFEDGARVARTRAGPDAFADLIAAVVAALARVPAVRGRVRRR